MTIKLHKLSINSYISFILFVNGKYHKHSFSSIAKERGLTRKTILNHVLPYIVGGIERNQYKVKRFVDPEKYQLIHSYLENNHSCSSVNEIHSFFKGKLSYDEIWIGLALFLNKDDSFSKVDIRKQFERLDSVLRNKRIVLNPEIGIPFITISRILFYQSGWYKVIALNGTPLNGGIRNYQKEPGPSFFVSDYTVEEQKRNYVTYYEDRSNETLEMACDGFYDAMLEVDDRD